MADEELDRTSLDAARYRKLRAMHWSESPLAVVSAPKQNVKLGAYCPSLALLDEELDKLAESGTAGAGPTATDLLRKLVERLEAERSEGKPVRRSIAATLALKQARAYLDRSG